MSRRIRPSATVTAVMLKSMRHLRTN